MVPLKDNEGGLDGNTYVFDVVYVRGVELAYL